jgi:hypothetical protein
MTYVHTSSRADEPHVGHVWRTETGVAAAIYLNAVASTDIQFNSPGEARELAALCTEAAERMAALMAGIQAEAKEGSS